MVSRYKAFKQILCYLSEKNMMNNQSFMSLRKHRYWYERLGLIIADEQELGFSDIISLNNVELFL